MKRDLLKEIAHVRGLAVRAGLTASAVALLFLVIAGTAAAAPPTVWTKCETGSGAGQCKFPRGIAANPENGHVFVADQGNARVVELNALGQFIKTWGWDVVESGPGNVGTGFEICVPRNGDVCKGGSEGSGAGQFSPVAPGVAVDSAGNIYVTDRGFLGSPNLRVQKFSPSGQFLLMFGGKVNRTKEEASASEGQQNLCPVDSGDVCQAGTAGTGNGQFGQWAIGNFIAIDGKGTPTTADDKVYVGDENRIQVFNTEGLYQESISLPGVTVQSLAVDGAGNLYAIYGGKVHKLSPTGVPLAPEIFEIPKVAPSESLPAATAVAVDSDGNVYAFGPTSGGSSSGTDRNPIVKFDSSGKLVEEFGQGEFSASSTGLATNLCPGSEVPGNLYASNPSETDSFVRAYGTPPVGCFKATTREANPIAEHGATLNGTVNPSGLVVSECFFEYGTTTNYGSVAQCEAPAAGEIGTEPVQVHADIENLLKGTVYHFHVVARVGSELETGGDVQFKTLGPPVISKEHVASVTFTEATLKALVNPEGFATVYHFEYTTEAEFEAHEFEGAQSTDSIAIGSNREDRAVGASLKGLSPGTAYRWRVFAENSSGTTEAPDQGLITYRTVESEPSCPNQQFRTGPSALLPDCRAYEMVSPIDKNGADIVSALSGPGNPGGYVQSSLDGERIAYASAFTAFAGEPASFKFNQYLAERGADGWSTEGIHPPALGRVPDALGAARLAREFSAFSPDLCSAWLYDPQTPAVAADGQQVLPNLYRRQNCGAGAGDLETLTSTASPLTGTELEYVNQHSVQGFSDDGRHTVFIARAKLNDEAAAGPRSQIYDHFGGENHLVSVLPIPTGGKPDETSTAVGSGPVGAAIGGGDLENAVSADGSRVYWTSGMNEDNGIGKIYLRENPEQQQSALAHGSASGTGTLTNGSATVTALVAAKGTGDLTAGSATVSGLKTTVGQFLVGQPVNPVAGKIPAGTTIVAVGEASLTLSAPAGASASGVTIVSTGPQPFAVGQTISGSGIPFGTTIIAVAPGSLTLSKTAKATSGGVKLEALSECTETVKACTLPVSEGPVAFYWGAAADGSKALYQEPSPFGAASLFVWDLKKAKEGVQARSRVVSEVKGVAGMSEDLTRIYFVATEVLTGSEENSEKEKAIEGEPNLYLDEEGTKSFVATLVAGDVGTPEPGSPFPPYDLSSKSPYDRATRVNSSGSRIVFNSRAPLTDFDNTDPATGKPAVEVYTYEAGGALTCVSCNPSGAQPSGIRELRIPYRPPFELNDLTNVPAAAWIPTWEHKLQASNVVSQDGNRIFFNSNDALLPRDINGNQDVYEWEASDEGSCREESPNFFPENGGCLYLISSGESSHESEFWEASPDGSNVFFTTESSLLPQDPGSIDLYDARVDGGFPAPQASASCEGEACQSPPPPPPFGTPASSSYNGPPNPKPGKSSCPKGKHKVKKDGKTKCVKKNKKKSAKHKRGASHKRGAAR